MPDPKTPQEKKRLSMTKDRRNTYGENDKATRKNIPRSKQGGRMRLRKAVHQALGRAKGAAEPESEDEAENRVAAVQSTAKRRLLFRKWPDTPLGEVLERKRRRRQG
ncbi:MAG: hypothetical protein JF887_09235 [Candidatus Dormibacteraeota bacterium]|uniref:Uncharacterized protein n=1 Tax=Candidatus Amunia macphersoniae TaxID=3127014 RepID=A0A934NF82_9BACT|nr:hypothetical protein [Candidatus Dormibacteraeota bacterium]